MTEELGLCGLGNLFAFLTSYIIIICVCVVLSGGLNVWNIKQTFFFMNLTPVRSCMSC